MRPNNRTGLAARLREWMSAQKKPFSAEKAAKGLGIEPGKDHADLNNTIGDFLDRGEIMVVKTVFNKQNRRQNFYRYTRKPGRKHPAKDKIFKAIYVSSSFATRDIQRLSGSTRDYAEEVIKRLCAAGHLTKVGSRHASHGAGKEALYRVVDRDRFRKDVML